MRISKYVPLFGIGADSHVALPPSIPPPPPAIPNPSPIPMNRFLVTIVVTATAEVTGKYALQSVMTEGQGAILWQYDWGPGQLHIAIGPAFLTPSMALLPLGSATKYFLPSFAVEEQVDGGALASLAGGRAPVAVSWPVYCITTNQCQDIGGLGFMAPTSVCFQNVSTRWVGFNWGDLAAGLIVAAGDAAASLILSHFGGRILPNSIVDDVILGGLSSTFMAHLSTAIQSLPYTPLVFTGGTGAGLGLLAIELPVAGAVVLAPMAALGASLLATEVGEEFGSTEADVGPAPDEAGAPAAPGAGSGAPASSSPPGGPPAPASGTPAAGSGGPTGGSGAAPADAGPGSAAPDAGTGGGPSDAGSSPPGGVGGGGSGGTGEGG
jgi:hypothetical protein